MVLSIEEEEAVVVALRRYSLLPVGSGDINLRAVLDDVSISSLDTWIVT